MESFGTLVIYMHLCVGIHVKKVTLQTAHNTRRSEAQKIVNEFKSQNYQLYNAVDIMAAFTVEPEFLTAIT